MIILIAIGIILVISIILAIRSLHELETPRDLAKLSRRKSSSGVILFLRKKIIHYSDIK
jgi:hypothetical protein